MIWNIRDHRTRPYRWAKVNAIIEATWNDNGVDGGDAAPAPRDDEYVLYDERTGVSVREAVEWANGQPGPVTLFLYDDGGGIGPAPTPGASS